MADRIILGEELYKKKEALRKLRTDNINWVVYFIDDETGEKWIEEYPFSEMHGGGPPQLRMIEKFPWEKD